MLPQTMETIIVSATEKNKGLSCIVAQGSCLPEICAPREKRATEKGGEVDRVVQVVTAGGGTHLDGINYSGGRVLGLYGAGANFDAFNRDADRTRYIMLCDSYVQGSSI